MQEEAVQYLIAIWLCSILGGLDLVKVIFVELADKTRKVVVLEVSWQDDFGKLVGFLDHKRFAVPAPGNGQVVLLFLEHPFGKKRDRERERES